MLTVPPKTFLDTQIISDVERGAISSSDWERAKSYLREATRYCISPLTVGELLAALTNGGEEYFDKHQRRLRLLLAPGPPSEVFDFIRYFYARELGLNIQRPSHLEDDFLNVIALILAAPSKAALLDGFTHPKNSQQTVKIRIDRFIEENQQLKRPYIDSLEQLKKLGKIRISPDEWAANLLRFSGVVDPNDLTKRKIAENLFAAYEFEMVVLDLVRNRNFSIEKNISDQVDGQQLYYLCDPNTVFITNDSDFKNRIKGAQAKRIKTLAELLDCAEEKS